MLTLWPFCADICGFSFFCIFIILYLIFIKNFVVRCIYRHHFVSFSSLCGISSYLTVYMFLLSLCDNLWQSFCIILWWFVGHCVFEEQFVCFMFLILCFFAVCVSVSMFYLSLWSSLCVLVVVLDLLLLLLGHFCTFWVVLSPVFILLWCFCEMSMFFSVLYSFSISLLLIGAFVIVSAF